VRLQKNTRRREKKTHTEFFPYSSQYNDERELAAVDFLLTSDEFPVRDFPA